MAQENSVQVLLYVNLSPFYYNFMSDDFLKKGFTAKKHWFLIIYVGNYIFLVHRLKTELDLQRLFLAPVPISNSSPPPAFGLIYEGAIGQPR